MPAISVTVTGNLAGDPELTYTAQGRPVARFTVVSNERYKDGKSGEWKDGPTSFVRCNAWADLAEHVAESFAKGDRVIVAGDFRQRDYETKEGEKRSVWELTASEVGASVRFATVKIAKVERNRDGDRQESRPARQGAGDPWESGVPDEPPF